MTTSSPDLFETEAADFGEVRLYRRMPSQPKRAVLLDRYVRLFALYLARPGTTDGGLLLSGASCWQVIEDVGTLRFSWTCQSTPASQVKTPTQTAIEWIKTATGFADQRVAQLLGVSRQRLHAWQQGARIFDRNRRRLFAVREVLERAASRHEQPDQLAAWLDTPRGADARTPAQLLEAGEIDRARLLAVATPSRGVAPAPVWIRRPMPDAFRQGRETRIEAHPPDESDPDLDLPLMDEESDTDGGWVE
jgi:hypothetical protein